MSETNEEKSIIGILFQFNIDTPLIIHDTLPGPYLHHNLFIFGEIDTDTKREKVFYCNVPNLSLLPSLT